MLQAMSIIYNTIPPLTNDFLFFSLKKYKKLPEAFKTDFRLILFFPELIPVLKNKDRKKQHKQYSEADIQMLHASRNKTEH